MTSRIWYLVRHGETEWNATSRMQGQLDSPLTPLGREHARNTARLLARLGVDTVFASPLGRVRETLAIVDESLHLPATFDDRLKEWSAGDWSGEFYDDVRSKWPDDWAAWHADRHHARPPGGENFVDLEARACAFFADTAITPAARIAIVAHGFINRALASVLLSLTPAESTRIQQTNDTVIRIIESRGGTEVDHFVGGEGPRPGLPVDAAPVGESM